MIQTYFGSENEAGMLSRNFDSVRVWRNPLCNTSVQNADGVV